jgi:predicted nucleic acid-binding protein
VSPAILRELAYVLRDILHFEEADIVARLKLVARVAEIATPTITTRVITDGPRDDRIAECAVAGAAGSILCGDRHPRKLRSFRNVGIVQPRDFLRTLG